MLPFEGRKFELGVTDCYTLFRDYYQKEYGIEMRNYARPDAFWEHDMNLYLPRYWREGFQLVDGPLQEGDAILMAINSTHGNHVAIVMADGQILHHMITRLSRIEPYSAMWRNMTVAVGRHPKVTEQLIVPETEHIDLREVLRNAKSQ